MSFALFCLKHLFSGATDVNFGLQNAPTLTLTRYIQPQARIPCTIRCSIFVMMIQTIRIRKKTYPKMKQIQQGL